MENETPNETVNRTLAEFMNLCWHGKTLDWWCCEEAANLNRLPLNPDYCSRDSPRRLLDEVVAKAVTEFGAAKVGGCLSEMFDYDDPPWHLLATPEQIARAIYAVIKENK